MHEKNKGKGGGKEGLTRRSKPLPPGSDEEQDGHTHRGQASQDKTKQQDKTTPQDRVKRQDKGRAQEKREKAGGEGKQKVGSGTAGVKGEGEVKVNGVEKGRRVLLAEHKTIKMVKVDKLPKSFSVSSSIKQEPPLPAMEESETEDDSNRISDAKSEGSDLESTPVAPGMVSPPIHVLIATTLLQVAFPATPPASLLY